MAFFNSSSACPFKSKMWLSVNNALGLLVVAPAVPKDNLFQGLAVFLPDYPLFGISDGQKAEHFYIAGNIQNFLHALFVKPTDPAGTQTQFGRLEDHMFHGNAKIYLMVIGPGDQGSHAICQQVEFRTPG